MLHFSFSTLGYKEIGLEAGLHQALDNKAREAGFVLTQKGLGPRFQELLQRLGKGERKVVLLIDEYDKPLVDYIDDLEKAQENRDILKGFFSVLKDADPYLRFFLITGVSKSSKVSLFSDLNNLEDITLAPSAATLTGYTQTELEHHFEEPFREMAAVRVGSISSFQKILLSNYQCWRTSSYFASSERSSPPSPPPPLPAAP